MRRRRALTLPGPRLLEARELARELADDAAGGREEPPAAGSQLRYEVLLREGTVRFADTAATSDPALARTQALVRAIAKDVCGRER